MTTTTLPAFPGLLRRGSPVVGRYGPGATFIEYADCNEARVVLAADDGVETVPLAELTLDLSDPTGADHAARWLAEQADLEISVTAPRWALSARAGPPNAAWRLSADDGSYRLFADSGLFTHLVVGIGTVTDPLIALRMACLAIAEQNGLKP